MKIKFLHKISQKAWVISLMLLSLFLLPHLAFSASPEKECCQYKLNSLDFAEKIRDNLTLSDKQFEKLKLIFSEYSQIADEQTQKLLETISKIRTEVLAKMPDLKKLQNLFEEKAEALSAMEYASIDKVLKIKQLLTPQQFELWRKIVKEENLKNKSLQKQEHRISHENFREEYGEQFLQELKQKLELSNEQLSKVETILSKSSQQIWEKRNQLSGVFSNIRNELLKPEPQLKDISSNIQQKFKIFSEMEYLAIERDLQLKNELSTEQLQQWQGAIKEQLHGR